MSKNVNSTAITRKERKFFIFDRDDTLVDSDNNLINKREILSIIRTIDQNPEYSWAIASAGAIDLQHDPAYLAITGEIELSGNTPHYVQVARGTSALINRIHQMDFLEFNHSLNIEFNNTAHIALEAALNGQEYEVDDENKWVSTLKHPAVSFTFDNNSKVTFKFGNTLICMDLKQLVRSIKKLQEGDFKLFFILDALDQAKLKIDLDNCRGLQEFGILSIQTPDNYESIEPSNIIFCDDKPGCVKLASEAGFFGIVADTKCAARLENAKTHDRYLILLYERLGFDQNKQFLSSNLFLKIISSPEVKIAAGLLLIAGLAALTIGTLGIAGVITALAGTTAMVTAVVGSIACIAGTCLVLAGFFASKSEEKQTKSTDFGHSFVPIF